MNPLETPMAVEKSALPTLIRKAKQPRLLRSRAVVFARIYALISMPLVMVKTMSSLELIVI